MRMLNLIKSMPEQSNEIIAAIVMIALVFVLVLVLWSFIRKRGRKAPEIHPSERLGFKEYEQQMAALAYHHHNVKNTRYNSIIRTYNQQEYIKLNKIRNRIAEMPSDIIALIPSARWLFDNFQMLYREIKKVKSSTIRAKLPVLNATEYRSFPRIYIIAKKMIEISGGYLSEDNIILMLQAYQKITPLTDFELWCLPEMMGLCLLERVIQVSDDIISVIRTKYIADRFVKERIREEEGFVDITSLLEKQPGGCEKNISFHAHVLYLLKSMSMDEETIQKYIAFHCQEEGNHSTSIELFKEESRVESALESDIRTLIVSLREINQLDEEMLFEALSPLEQILMQDPDGIYPSMDFNSKGYCRKVIEDLAEKYRRDEYALGQVCLSLAQEGLPYLNHPHHVGTYLLGKGLPAFKAKLLGKRLPVAYKPKHNLKVIFYFICSGLFLLVSYWAIYKQMDWATVTSIRNYILFIILSLPLFIGIALKLSRDTVTWFIPATKIPSMDYSEEIPDTARTFVVMPVLISSAQQAEEYMNRLEKHYLANRQPNLCFALLVDYPDAPQQVMPEDEPIQNALLKKIKQLNGCYPRAYPLFCLFIRARLWNEAEECFMGWERKRGKLEEFNALLNGVSRESTSFTDILCDEELLETFRYVITLDADSNLVFDHASKLVGLIDHPLNRAIVNPETNRVVEGYAIIQPSVKNHILQKSAGFFTRVFSGQTGLANYSAMQSDVYQDIFMAGTFIGKGIYNVRVFHSILYKTLPENSILSHDLLESCYVNTAFNSSASIMENYPSSFLSGMEREHRWIRGDWQLLPWLLKKNNLNKISRWKILDNLRSSLVPISKLLLILFNVAFIPRLYYLSLIIIYLPDILSLIVFTINVLLRKVADHRLTLVRTNLLREIGMMLTRGVFESVFIPYKVYNTTDAILRTLYRLLISKKKLLRWKTSDLVDRTMSNTLTGYFRKMWPSIIIALLTLALVAAVLSPTGIILFGIIAIGWILSFVAAWLISRPKKLKDPRKAEKQNDLLLDTARRTWGFFKQYSTQENNWLCPDNFQITNKEKVTERTSPTNIGFQLLSVLSARDLGFITLSYMMEYLENLMYTIAVLPKWKGHLYNWVDIRSLEVLPPHYVSTVDSGNFCGYLYTLKNGLEEQLQTPLLPDSICTNLCCLLKQSHTGLSLGDNIETLGDFFQEIDRIQSTLQSHDQRIWEDSMILKELTDTIASILSEAEVYGLSGSPLSVGITLAELIRTGNLCAAGMKEQIYSVCSNIEHLLNHAEFSALFNKKRMLFHIGYHVDSQTIDGGCYDLIASESVLTSYLAIARGEVSVKHWNKLGRPLAMIHGVPAFVSWSGTMFEYLMPGIVMKEYQGSTFSDSFKAAVYQQIRYGRKKGIPWGISESQHYRFDLDSNYQYRAFGVPKLRLQPSYCDSLVVAPYATMLALEYNSREAIANLERMKAMGAFGEYGFFESIDFNAPNPAEMTDYCIVKSFMAHHQGMSLAAINNYLNHGILRTRFHAEPMIQSAEVLLEEKRQTNLVSISKRGYVVNVKDRAIREEYTPVARYVRGVSPSVPVVNYLSNGKYSMLITSDGDGYSQCENRMVYRWRPDLYASSGNYLYIRNLSEKRFWSAAYKPTKAEPDDYQVKHLLHQTEFVRRDGEITTETVVSISPDHNLEIRRVTLTNHGKEDRVMEITSYLEVVGDYFTAELSHPAFNKLFIESEYLDVPGILISKRRTGGSESQPCVMHMVKSENEPFVSLEYENDRKRFLGRNHSVESPLALEKDFSLSSSAVFSTDPIMSIRVRVLLKAEQRVSMSFLTGLCADREDALKISDEFSEPYRVKDVIEKFRQQSEIEQRYLSITNQQLQAFQNIISPLFYPSINYRGPAEYIRRNWKNQSFLWRFGVSGDNPIMIMRVSSIEEAGILRDVLKAYEYLRTNQIRVDLIILSEAKQGYMQELYDQLNDMTSSLKIYDENRERPNLFILHAYQMVPAEIDLLFTVARVVFSKHTGIYFRNIKAEQKEILADDS